MKSTIQDKSLWSIYWFMWVQENVCYLLWSCGCLGGISPVSASVDSLVISVCVMMHSARQFVINIHEWIQCIRVRQWTSTDSMKKSRPRYRISYQLPATSWHTDVNWRQEWMFKPKGSYRELYQSVKMSGRDLTKQWHELNQVKFYKQDGPIRAWAGQPMKWTTVTWPQIPHKCAVPWFNLGAPDWVNGAGWYQSRGRIV